MDRVIASGGRLNVKASYIEVLNEAKANISAESSEGKSENPGDREDDGTALAGGNSPIQSEGECDGDSLWDSFASRENVGSQNEDLGSEQAEEIAVAIPSVPVEETDGIPSLSEWLERARSHYAFEYGKNIEQIQILPLGEAPKGDDWGVDDAISYPPDLSQGYRVWIRDDEALPEDSAFDADDTVQQSGVKLQKWTEEQTLLMAQKYQISPERIYLSLAFVGQKLGSGWVFKETLRYDNFTEIAVYLLRNPLETTPLDDEKVSSPIPLKLTELIDPLSSVKPILDAPQLAPHRQELERILGELSPQGQVIAAEGFLLGSLDWVSSVNPSETEARALEVLNRGIELIASVQFLRQDPEKLEQFKRLLAEIRLLEPVGV